MDRSGLRRFRPKGTLMLFALSLSLCTTSQALLHFAVQPASGVAARGRPHWLYCKAEGEESPATYLWRFNETDITTSNLIHVSNRISFPNGTLLIADVEEDNVGQYTCVATSGGSSIYSRPATLQLAYIAQNFSIHPQNTTVTVGQAATLTCAIQSLPSAHFVWRQNGLDLPFTTVNSGQGLYANSLSLSSVTYGTAGGYVCAATNILAGVTRLSSTAFLTVVGPPEMTSEPRAVSLPVGYNGSLHCAAIGVPTPSVTWYKATDGNSRTQIQSSDRVELYPNGTLHLLGVRTEDGGEYTCVASNAHGQVSLVVPVSVTGVPSAPVIEVRPQDQRLTQGSRLVLNCSASGNPTPAISWWKDGAEIVTETEGSLQLPEVRPTDAGSYVCRALNTEGNDTVSAHVNVLYAPLVVRSPENVTTREGGEVRLPCGVAASPTPVVQWITPGSGGLLAFGGSGRWSVDVQGTLTIADVRSEDEGRYECYARNDLGSVSVIVMVTIEGEPHFTTQPRSQVALSGEATTISCNAAGYPSPVVTWYRLQESSEERLEQTQRLLLLPNGDLTIVLVALEDDGAYRCEARNAYGIVQAVAVLTVHAVPEFVEAPTSQSVLAGDNVYWTCRVRGVPVPSQRWTRAGQTLTSAGNVAVSADYTQLNITAVRLDQAGPYTCVASNQAGQRSATASIYLSGQPYLTLQPVNVTVNVSQPALLSCRAGQSDLDPNPDPSPPAILVWHRGSQHQETDVAVSGREGGRVWTTPVGDLIFQEVVDGDEGWYHCQVRQQEAAAYSDPAYLNVQAPPSIENISRPALTSYQGQATLTCYAAGDPDPEVTWRSPGGREVAATSLDYGVDRLEGSLTIRAARTDRDGGNWTCLACNVLGCDAEVTHLAVQGPPVIRTVEASRNQTTLRMACRPEGLPAPAVSYWTEGVEVSSDLQGHVTAGEAGGWTDIYVQEGAQRAAYTCVASNSYGSDTVELTAPLAPVLSTARTVPSTGDVILVMNVTGKLGSLPLEAVIAEYRLASEVGDAWTSAYIQVNGSAPSTGGRGEMEVSLPGLVLYNAYLLRARLVNVLGPGTPSDTILRIATSVVAPSFVPSIVSVVAISDTAISVTWSVPSDSQPSGLPLAGYVVRVASPALERSPSDVYVNGTQAGASYTVNGLHERREYTFAVAAFNAGGIGRFSQPMAAFTLYASVNNETSTPATESSWRGQQWVAVLGGCLAAAFLLFLLACAVWQWRRRYHGNSLDLLQPSHGLDPRYLESSNSVVNCTVESYKKKPDDISFGIYLRNDSPVSTVHSPQQSEESLSNNVFSQSDDAIYY